MAGKPSSPRWLAGTQSARPRTGDEDAPELAEPERRMAAEYFDGPEMTHDGRHPWLCIAPLKLVSWDFRKLADLSARPLTDRPEP